MSSLCGLAKVETHQAIHNSVTADLDAAMRLLRSSLQAGRHSEAYELAGAILAIWSERELWHAQAEEAELYRHIPAMSALHRDHDLMAQWVMEARTALEREDTVSALVMTRLEALSILLDTHNVQELEHLRISAGGTCASPAEPG
jgi:hypothetical protein